MTKRRLPIETPQHTTVIYPSSLFSLEKDEVFPYERFAYDILDIAIEALTGRALPTEIEIDFTQPESDVAPWVINASVQAVADSTRTTTRYRFSTPELFPTLAYIYSVVIAHSFIEGSDRELSDLLQTFVGAVNRVVSVRNEKGFAHSIRAAYEYLELTVSDLLDHGDAYDLLIRHIALHEVAHVYALHLEQGRSVTPVHRRAFELIADLLAAGWMYRKMVVNTPDTEEYRQMRGFSSHAEAIFSNCLMTQRAQEALVCFMAIAGAQRSKGLLTLDGGTHHPPGLQRYFLQAVHFDTYLRSNFGTLLSPEQISMLSDDRERNLMNLLRSGTISLADIDQWLDTREFDTVEAAADLIEEMQIEELWAAVPLLRQAREMTDEKLRSKRASDELFRTDY